MPRTSRRPGAAPAGGCARLRRGSGSLYASRTSRSTRKRPTAASGRSNGSSWQSRSASITLPWLRWDRGPYLPDQAVLIDLPARRFYFFFHRDLAAGILLRHRPAGAGALALFLVTSVAGRVWCGYTCPQTVWTDLMIAVERFWQGDRNARLRLDKHPGRSRRFGKKAITHLTWLADRRRHRRRLGVLFRRCADAGQAARDVSRRRPSPICSSACSRYDLCAWRHRARAGVHLYVPLAAHPGRDVRPRLAA